MQLIDTHIHLYESDFSSDIEAVVTKATTNGVKRMLIPNVDKHSVTPMKKVVQKFPGVCLPMLGLHPCYVKEDYEIQLEDLKAELDSAPYIAIGEIGLDLYWDKTFFEEQKKAFITQLKWSAECKLPVSIHSREATREAIDCVKSITTGPLKGVFHCFTGTINEAFEIIESGFLLGIGGVVTFKNSGLDKVLPSIPLENLVLETDGPYLAPVPFRGKRNESSYLSYIVKKLEEIYNASSEEIAFITTKNACKLFNLPGD